jgi:hypothetical protein
MAMEIPTVVSMFAEPLNEVMANLNRKFRQAWRPSAGPRT